MDQGRSSPPPAVAGKESAAGGMIEPQVPARLRWLARLVAATPGDRVVDLGCGTGTALEMVAATLPAPAGALDASAAALREAAGRLSARAALLVHANLAGRLPLAAASVDRVLCHNVLECLPNPDALLAEAVRILRPGGRLVLSHSDFDTLVFASEDLELTRRLARAYCDTQQDWMDAVDGTIGRRLVDIVLRARLQVLDVQARVNLSRSFQPGELGHGYAYNLAGVRAAAARPTPPSWTGGWRGCAGSMRAARSCSASTTTPSLPPARTGPAADRPLATRNQRGEALAAAQLAPGSPLGNPSQVQLVPACGSEQDLPESRGRSGRQRQRDPTLARDPRVRGRRGARRRRLLRPAADGGQGGLLRGARRRAGRCLQFPGNRRFRTHVCQ